MVLSLKLELKSNNHVLVTNLETKEQRETTLDFVQKITNNTLSTLCQYKYYELIINAQRYWSRIKHFDAQIEAEEVRQINLKYKKIINKKESAVEEDREQDDNLKLQKNCHKILTALQYADYCLEYDNRYNSKEENIKIRQDRLKQEQDNYNFVSMLMKEQEQKIIALQTENQVLRRKIVEFRGKYVTTEKAFIIEKTEHVFCEVLE